ncbi:MAG: TrkA family potassium uptake protein [Deltaproteobacteria bacterium]|nr:MAG: TrkA family potassium uptake protein [Deltaproteobacteria bacterium]
MSQRYFVIGLGQFGYHLALSLSQTGAEVVALDTKMDIIEQIKDEVSQAVCVDASREENLRALSIDKDDIGLVTIGEDDLENSILATAILAQLKCKRIVARATNDLHAKILRIVGAHEVVNPERDLAERIAQRIVQRGLVDLIPLSGDYAMSEIIAPRQFVGQTLTGLNLRQTYGVNVIAIKHKVRKFVEGTETEEEELLTHNPHPSTFIQENDILLCIGTIEDIERIATLCNKQ